MAKKVIDEVRLSKIIYRSIRDAALAQGLVHPKGKSEAALAAELQSLLASDRIQFLPVIEHRAALLSHARAFRSHNECELACMLFATWIEHWVNSQVRGRSIVLSLSEAQTKRIIRSAQLGDKLDWLLPLMGASPITEHHSKSILRLAELRNAFVHYKWEHVEFDLPPPSESKYCKVAASIEKTIRYLQAYERAYVRRGQRRSPGRRKSRARHA
jgi:hypothetical protein